VKDTEKKDRFNKNDEGKKCPNHRSAEHMGTVIVAVMRKESVLEPIGHVAISYQDYM